MRDEKASDGGERLLLYIGFIFMTPTTFIFERVRL